MAVDEIDKRVSEDWQLPKEQSERQVQGSGVLLLRNQKTVSGGEMGITKENILLHSQYRSLHLLDNRSSPQK